MQTFLVTLTTLLEIIYVSASPLSTNIDTRSKVICGQAGYDAGTESFWGQSGVEEASCESQCTQQNCKSFAYGQGECQLYDVAVRSNFVAVGDSPYLFYDSSCITSTTSTTSTTSVASTIKTSTTTMKTTVTTKVTTTSIKATTASNTSTKNVASTTTAKITTTTTSTISSTSQICGQQGNNVGAQSIYSDDFEVIEGCTNVCAEYNCVSFAYGAGECYLYNVSASSGFVASDDSWYNIYDSSCFNVTYTPPIDPSQVCGTACFFPDDHYDLAYYNTDFGSPTQEAFDDCYQKCVTYDDGYCDGWLWRSGECQLWREQPTPDDLRWHPMKSNYCWARDCGAPNINGGSTSSTIGTTSSKTTVTSTKLTTTITTAKKTSSTTSAKATTTTSTKTHTSTSSTTVSATKSTSSTSTKTSSASSTTTTAKSTATTSPSTTKTSAQTTTKATTTTTVRTTTKPLTTTSATSTASNSGLICGQQGYFSGSSGFHGYSTDYDQPTQQALSQCYQYCVNSDEGYCAGWYWSSNTCVLFSYAPEGTHFQASSNSGMYVWDRGCGAPVATYGASTTTTKTSTKTSSTSSQKSSGTSSSKSTSTIR